ncbi:unnamed protein product, partial [marine sediment metagenome]
SVLYIYQYLLYNSSYTCQHFIIKVDIGQIDVNFNGK